MTITDVALAAGVAIGTASKALNGRGKLRPETRERVRAAADRLGFRPNHLAHSLRRGRTFTVGLLASDDYARFSLPVVSGLEDALGDARISVFLCPSREDPRREALHVESLLSKRVDGVVVVGARIDPRPPVDLHGADIPVIYAFARTADPRALALVPDDAQGGGLAANHLADLGRRRFAHITGPAGWDAVVSRRDGFQRALRERGLDCPPERVFPGPWGEAWGYETAQRLLDSRVECDALFCGNDRIARGAIDALRERGVRVPDDIAVVGYDNWEIFAAATRPPLTTVDMNLEALGRAAGQRLLALISGKPETGTIRLPCTLVVRASCGATTRTPVAADALGADGAE